MTKFIDSLSKKIYEENYKYQTDTVLFATFLRIAKDISSVEENKEEWTQKFLELLQDFKFLPGGRIISNAGTGLKGTSYINCFVDGFDGENQDSMEGISRALSRQARILKSEGGYGFCADVIRPRGEFIEGIGGETPGPIAFLELWDKQSDIITRGSGVDKKTGRGKKKIRKGAQMVTMSIWHPDIIEFITAKQTHGKFTKFNMSVLITDEFMNAVYKNLPWSLEFPDLDWNKKIYDKEWDGNIKKWKEKGYPIKIWKTFPDAEILWNLIMKSCYNRAEPGVLFIDTINKMNNLYYCEYINATNPCGEQVLPLKSVCNLGSINLTQFINQDGSNWDFEKLAQYIPLIVRFMDNINDVTNVPIEDQLDNLRGKRRMGVGYMGYASALLMMRVKYGSKEALDLTDSLCKFVTNELYRASSLLAKEKGPFKYYDAEKYLNGEFIKILSEDVIESIKMYGMRNSHLTSIQPTGNSSIFANNVSGGLEPIFNHSYIRTVRMDVAPSHIICPKVIDWANKVFELNDQLDGQQFVKWDWIKEGDEPMLKCVDNSNRSFKIDQNRGYCEDVWVKDYAVHHLELNGGFNKDLEYVATAMNGRLSIDDHIETMKVFGKYIDSAMSKTINLPNDYPFDKFKTVYKKIFETGYLKGCTVYREGTMNAVLSTGESKKDDFGLNKKITKNNAPKRPKDLPCDIHQIMLSGIKWIILIGKLEDDPFEVFAFVAPKKWIDGVDTGITRRNESGHYDLILDDGWELKNIIDRQSNSGQENTITRLISTALRHGTDIEFIVAQMTKAGGDIFSFNKVITRTLKKYIKEVRSLSCPECKSKNIILQEGCFKCAACGHSKCE